MSRTRRRARDVRPALARVATVMTPWRGLDQGADVSQVLARTLFARMAGSRTVTWRPGERNAG